MFGNFKQKFAMVAVVTVGVVAAPSVASADTAIPPLSAGDTQAFASLTAGGPRITVGTTRDLSGPVTLTPVGSTFTVTCTVTARVLFNVDGTTRVPVANFTNCVTNAPGCDVSAAATAGSLTPNGWGNRLVTNGTPAVFRDRINVAFTNTLTNTTAGACPAPNGPYAYTGLLSPRLTGGGPGVANATFDAASGTVTSPLGPATASGQLVLEAGQAPIFFRN